MHKAVDTSCVNYDAEPPLDLHKHNDLHRRGSTTAQLDAAERGSTQYNTTACSPSAPRSPTTNGGPHGYVDRGPNACSRVLSMRGPSAGPPGHRPGGRCRPPAQRGAGLQAIANHR